MNEPTDFETWCRHYDYDPTSEQASTDYDEYLRQIDLFADLAGDDQGEQIEGPTP